MAKKHKEASRDRGSGHDNNQKKNDDGLMMLGYNRFMSVASVQPRFAPVRLAANLVIWKLTLETV